MAPDRPARHLPGTARLRLSIIPLAAALLLQPALWAEASDPAALAVVKQAVTAELNAARTDRTPWAYRDHDIQPGKDAVEQVIETPKGDLHRTLELNGKPLTGAAADKELARMRQFVNSPEEQARRRKAAESDGAQAAEFLRMLPEAFVWTIVTETPQAVTLKFHPNPDFSPPDAQSRVLGVMAGQMTVARDGNRIQSLRGTLTDDVKFGLGLFGKIDRGGTFNVERRELAPGKWQITESHVHIGGHALLFKTIGQQEDEVKTDWHLSTAPDLQAALQQLQK
jgi:hypothetical protein